MKADYKNWMPKGLIYGMILGFSVGWILFYVFGVSSLLSAGILKNILRIVLGAISVVLSAGAIWTVAMYRAFSYDGKRQMSKRIIDGIAECVNIPDGGTGLDVGCGSGALTIACAKRNPNAEMIGMDRWGKEYASFSKSLCERNARAEGVENVSFAQGDASKLDFPDEYFDAVTSNYVYHNIPSSDRQKLLSETLRTLKKGGTFAIHDLMSKSKYGDIHSFAEELKRMGYEEVKLMDTTKGMFMSENEARWMALSGSALLLGRK